MKNLMSTKEVAEFLNINEKMVYSLISDKSLPATKITGKWLFPKHLVEQWVENHTVNYPNIPKNLSSDMKLLVIAGSNDILLDRTISLFNRTYPEHVAVFGNLGSMGGIRTLRRRMCHMASSHLLQEDEDEYNFDFAGAELDAAPAIVNFCRREQGLLLQKGNPQNIGGVPDLARPGVRILNRPLGTGTRLLFDRALKAADIKPQDLAGYDQEFAAHMEVGVEILAGRADAAPCIRPVAHLLDLDFIPFRWERYDLIITRETFFEQGVQLFLSLLHDPAFQRMARKIEGYDVSKSGKMVYPNK